MAELKLKLIENVQEAKHMAVVRNSGREYMTHSQQHITPPLQEEWYRRYYRPAHKAGDMFGFIGYVEKAPAAYGMVSRREGRYWLTGVLTKEFRGQGLGRQLFEFLTDYVLNVLGDSAYLDVKETNAPARALYKKLGFFEMAVIRDTIVMIKDKTSV